MNELTQTIHLNPAQREAVEHLHGPLLVIAGAGSGKTRVITERLLYLLDAIPELRGENLLAITFTEKATEEMKARIRRRGDPRAAKVTVSTFHSFCYNLLREHHREVRILDKVDYWIFLRRRLPQLQLNLFKKLSEPGRFLNDFTEFFSRCQDELVSPEEYSRYATGLRQAFDREKSLLADKERVEREQEVLKQEEIARVYAAAEELLQQANRTTFGGSLLSAVHLLEENPQLREHYQERFRYIVVDEFQDTNIAQIRLLDLLAARHRNLMVVGDDDQAIYRFRGASYASFRRFAELYPDGRRISLTQNYRSTERILAVAGELIAQNGPARFDPHKKLLPHRRGGERILLAEIGNAAEEAAYVRHQVEQRRALRGGYRGIAVLYRSHAHRNALVEELARAGVPFVIRNLSILTGTLVRDLLAYLRSIHRPEDNISFARLLAIPAWRFTPEMLRDLIARARREKIPLTQAVETLHPRVRDQATALGSLLALLTEFRALAQELPLTALFDRLWDRLGVLLLPHDPDLHYLESFRRFLQQWEEEKSETRKLKEFLEYFDYFEEAGGSVNLPEDSPDPEAVQLMTVHAAKGLEFDEVFLLRLNSGSFPPRRHTVQFEFPEELMKEALPPGDFRIQEERRLCYVALTRARERLFLTTLVGPRKKESVFLEDILRSPASAAQIEQFRPDPPSPAATETGTSARSGQRPLLSRPADSTLYSQVAEWAADKVSGEIPDPVALSHSSLDTYDHCPLKYKFQHLWQLPGRPAPALVFGIIMHRSLAEYFRARRNRPALPLEELRHIYELQWETIGWPFRDAFQAEDYRTTGWDQLRAFFDNHAGKPIHVLETEKTFEWQWETIKLTGRIDQINRLDSGGVEIIEYKTGEPKDPKQIEKSRQLALYALAAERHLQQRPQRLTLYNLTLNQPHSFAPQEKTLDKTLEQVRSAAARIRNGEFPAQPGFRCRYCDYRSICPAHEQNLAVSATGKEERS